MKYFLESCISLFAIINPIGLLPILSALMDDKTVQERRHILRTAGFVALGIVVGMAILGQFLMSTVFHLEMHEFSFAGGLLLTVLGIYNMIVSNSLSTRRQEKILEDAAARENANLTLAVTPIASPLMVGPGTILTMMLIVQQYEQIGGPVLGRAIAVAVSLVTFIFVMAVLFYSDKILRLLGRIGALAVSRIMQIFIVAIGVRFMFDGLSKAFPMLTQSGP